MANNEVICGIIKIQNMKSVDDYEWSSRQFYSVQCFVFNVDIKIEQYLKWVSGNTLKQVLFLSIISNFAILYSVINLSVCLQLKSFFFSLNETLYLLKWVKTLVRHKTFTKSVKPYFWILHMYLVLHDTTYACSSIS